MIALSPRAEAQLDALDGRGSCLRFAYEHADATVHLGADQGAVGGRNGQAEEVALASRLRFLLRGKRHRPHQLYRVRHVI